MKILHVAPSYYPAFFWGGPIHSVHALNRSLSAIEDTVVTVLTTDAAGPSLRSRVDPSHTDSPECIRIVRCRRILGSSISIGLLAQLPKLVTAADVVHITATYSFPTLPTLLACRIFRKPVIWSPRGAIQDAVEWNGSNKKVFKRVWNKVCNKLLQGLNSVIHTTSEREYLATRGELPDAQAVVIPNGVDVPISVPPRNWLPAGCLRLMYIGRLSEKKGIENLLEAMYLLKSEKITLAIYGEGTESFVRKLKLQHRDRQLSATVVFRGAAYDEDKNQAFASADVCIVPSHTENFCMVVAEALAFGIPVIASYGTPWADIDKKGCGLWVANSAESLASSILQIRNLSLPEMGARGRQWMTDEYSWHAIAGRMRSVYSSLV